MEVVHSYFSRCLYLLLHEGKILTLQRYNKFLNCQEVFEKTSPIN